MTGSVSYSDSICIIADRFFPYRRTAYFVSNGIVAELLLYEAQTLCASLLYDKCCRKRSILSVVMHTVPYGRTTHFVTNSFLSDCLCARRRFRRAFLNDTSYLQAFIHVSASLTLFPITSFLRCSCYAVCYAYFPGPWAKCNFV